MAATGGRALVQKIRLDRYRRMAFGSRWPTTGQQGSIFMKLQSLLRATTVGALSLFAAGTIFPGAANADLVLINTATNLPILIPTQGVPPTDSAALSFTDLGAQGFGAAPRMLTTQGSGSQNVLTGSGTPIDVATGDAISGSNKTSTPTLGTLGWTNGGQVALGFNSDQTGGSGITLQALTLTIYDDNAAHTALGSFNLAPSYVGFTFSKEDLGLQQGNGNAVFMFGLTAAEATQFNNILTANVGADDGLFAGVSSTLGCPVGAPASCQPTNDGPDTWVGFARVPGPVVGAGFPGLVMACGGLLALARRRRQRQFA
jgi:hypothetical protein